MCIDFWGCWGLELESQDAMVLGAYELHWPKLEWELNCGNGTIDIMHKLVQHKEAY